MNIKRVKGIVTGEVQGVGFRAFAQRNAQNLGLGGWVKNRPDGNVQFEVEGSEYLIDKFLQALRVGPRFAEVAGIEIEEECPVEKSGNGHFEIIF